MRGGKKKNKFEGGEHRERTRGTFLSEDNGEKLRRYRGRREERGIGFDLACSERARRTQKRGSAEIQEIRTSAIPKGRFKRLDPE